MGDSDDEYDRKRRDKFRGERVEGSYHSAERSTRPREEWQGGVWARPRHDYGRGRDPVYSDSVEPAAKRPRQEYYRDRYYSSYQPFHSPMQREFQPPVTSDAQGSTSMMSFKAFLTAHDDNISESEALEKYSKYKMEYQRQQLNEFFVAHKEDEWFRMKYHPEDSVKRKEEQAAALKKRVEVFMELLNSNKIGSVNIDHARTNDLLKLLDTVMIKLENGTEEDISALEEEYADLERVKLYNVEESEKQESKSEIKLDEIETKVIQNNENDDKLKVDDNSLKEEGEEDDDEEEDYLKKETLVESGEIKNEEKEVEEADETTTIEEENKETKDKTSNSDAESDVSIEDEENVTKAKLIDDSVESLDNQDIVDKEELQKNLSDDEKETTSVKVIEDDVPTKKSRNLHKTTSIFLRNLAPSITRAEIEAMCSRYDGFLRVALADPQPERRWMCKGWVTFKRDAKIKDICWSFNNIRLRDCELGAIVSKDLSKRIRIVNGITAHKQVVRSDIQISAKVALHLDEQAGLWSDSKKKKKKSELTFGFVSNNPVLQNITDYLIEEASAEEEELLGLEMSGENQDVTSTVDRDDTLISVLDKIILYLRIVHSVDYYNHCKYPNEDEMPNRCGILHARGSPPTVKTDLSQFIGEPIEAKMSQFLPGKEVEQIKDDSKFIEWALKDADTEIDKFIKVNTKELAKDKWLCPLSGKKFKGPDFVRKHIFNKHAEKVEEVKSEVNFFNNYLLDPKRPGIEITQTKKEETTGFGQSGYRSNFMGRNHGASYSGNYRPQPRFYNQGYGRGRPFANHYNNRGSDHRPINHYRDLDAPPEIEEFI